MRMPSAHPKCLLAATLLLSLSACSTAPARRESSRPEPVLAIYRVRPGAEKELEAVLRSTWDTYRKERMVADRPHIWFRIKELDGTDERPETNRYVEVFAWVGYFATEYPPESVKRCWHKIRSLCQERNGPAVQFCEGEAFLK